MAEIAARAGLTKRTFVNHFADKREVFFEGAKALEATVVHQLDEAAGDLDPLDAAVFALTGAGDELAKYGAFGPIRRELIASSTDLQERELIKVAALSAAIAAGLRRRQVPAPDRDIHRARGGHGLHGRLRRLDRRQHRRLLRPDAAIANRSAPGRRGRLTTTPLRRARRRRPRRP